MPYYRRACHMKGILRPEVWDAMKGKVSEMTVTAESVAEAAEAGGGHHLIKSQVRITHTIWTSTYTSATAEMAGMEWSW